MAYVATNYANHAKAPVGKWACAPTSALAPFDEPPSGAQTKGSDLCGQCVSYVKTVCPLLPATANWKKGAAVRGNTRLAAGTVIATFGSGGHYEGHAAIYVSQNDAGITVYDQWISGAAPKPVGSRLLRWGAQGRSNNGDEFHVVD